MGLGDYVGMWRAKRRHRRAQQQQNRNGNRKQNQKQKRRDDGDCGPDWHCDVCDCSPIMLGSLLSLMAVSAPSRAPRRDPGGPGRAGMAAIRGYQRFVSPHLGIKCRQVPSCSNYGLQAVQRYGLVEGSRLTAARIKRCNPSTPRGTVDQVP
ncbi:membrane protein insertion efficiency factor YidD [Dactylosporangium sp. NPDC000244]|uniref:membrane protein insertion efficiency factor YidD n=1 Tax=Dactylosporangium sp. NPDC000244 TaxID=3154365 RepID=UPI00332A06AD